jgi:fused signal recognition particle receptor
LFDKLKTGFSSVLQKVSKSELDGRGLDQYLDEFKLDLIQNDVAVPVAERICDLMREKIRGTLVPRFSDKQSVVNSALKDSLGEIMTPKQEINLLGVIGQKRAQNLPAIFVFLGVNGTGKTTTIAKIAKLLMKNGLSVIIACADTYRAGAIEQMEEHAQRVGVRTIKHEYGSDAAAVAFDAINYARSHGTNVVLIDTAGRMQTNRNLLDEMRKIVRVSNPDLKILVVDALTANDAAEQSKVFNDAIGIDAIILAKLDADARGGSALSATFMTGKPVIYAGIGQGYDDLTPFSSDFVIKNILA